MVVVGLPYSFQGQMGVEEIMGGSPYGATTIAGGDGPRQPSRPSSTAPATRAASRRDRDEAERLGPLGPLRRGAAGR